MSNHAVSTAPVRTSCAPREPDESASQTRAAASISSSPAAIRAMANPTCLRSETFARAASPRPFGFATTFLGTGGEGLELGGKPGRPWGVEIPGLEDAEIHGVHRAVAIHVGKRVVVCLPL